MRLEIPGVVRPSLKKRQVSYIIIITSIKHVYTILVSTCTCMYMHMYMYNVYTCFNER